MAELESQPHWRQATDVVRTACRVPAEMTVLPPLCLLMALILTVLMKLEGGEALLASFRDILESNLIGPDGLKLRPPEPGPAVALGSVAHPESAAQPRSRTLRRHRGIPACVPPAAIACLVVPTGHTGLAATGPPSTELARCKNPVPQPADYARLIRFDIVTKSCPRLRAA